VAPPAGLAPGVFDAVVGLARTAPVGEGALQRLRAAATLAKAHGCDWLVAPGPGETLRADALGILAPAIGPYDAIFGAVHVTGSGEVVHRPSRLAFDAPERLPHALLNWWIGRTPFIRTDVALAMTGESGRGDDWLGALFTLWSVQRCIKLAAPLTDMAAPPAGLGAADRERVLARLAETPVFLPVAFGETVYRLPYTGLNAGIERDQTRGVFFEAAELGALKDRLGPGRRIVDIGANTGNHTVYFAGPMQAQCVVPFEPLPEIAAVLERAVAVNALGNVDLSKLRLGLSDGAGRMGIVRSERGGLGASRLVDDAEGEIAVTTLDDALTEPVDFLKIDVESMEMQVLAGASATIARYRPDIFIEIANDNTLLFQAWLQENAYRVERIFSDKGHANYLIAPDGARGG
jgi:FkbM family methyltransferase